MPMARAVSASAGKNDSIAISSRVTSYGVPRVDTIVKNASLSPSTFMRMGITGSIGPWMLPGRPTPG